MLTIDRFLSKVDFLQNPSFFDHFRRRSENK